MRSHSYFFLECLLTQNIHSFSSFFSLQKFKHIFGPGKLVCFQAYKLLTPHEGYLQGSLFWTYFSLCIVLVNFSQHVGMFFKVGGGQVFFHSLSKGFYDSPNNCMNHSKWLLDHVRHVWDIFGIIWPLKIIFQIRFSKTFAWKWVKNTFFILFRLDEGIYYVNPETKSFHDCG